MQQSENLGHILFHLVLSLCRNNETSWIKDDVQFRNCNQFLLHDVFIGEAYLYLSCVDGFILEINSRRPVSDAREQGTHSIIK
jgi:hypothetical protein